MFKEGQLIRWSYDPSVAKIHIGKILSIELSLDGVHLLEVQDYLETKATIYSDMVCEIIN